MKYIFRFCLFLVIFSLSAKEDEVFPEIKDEVIFPWFTGPLITQSFSVLPMGHINVEPYIFAYAITGSYNSHWNDEKIPNFWNNSFEVFTQIGIAPLLDIQFTPVLLWNYSEGSAHFEFGDFPVQIDLQIHTASIDDPIPGIKFFVFEIMPTGKYKNLDPNAHGTQIGGSGSWQTGFGFAVGNLYQIGKRHYVQWRYQFNYVIPAPVHVTGFNTYGGGPDADATVYPGNVIFTSFGIEYNLTQNWALALDLSAQWEDSDRFSGNPGMESDLSFANLGSGSTAQFSIAPAVEYNFSETLGIVAGGWLSVAGRNSSVFRSATAALNYYY